MDAPREGSLDSGVMANGISSLLVERLRSMTTLKLNSEVDYASGCLRGRNDIRHLIFEGEHELAVGYAAFSHMRQLESIVFRCPISKVELDAFSHNQSLRSVEFTEPIERIVDAFNDNLVLAHVIWPKVDHEDAKWSPRDGKLIRMVSGFNACDQLVPAHIPYELAHEVGGFQSREFYQQGHPELSLGDTLKVNDNSFNVAQLSPEQRAQVVVASMDVMDKMLKLSQ